MVKILKTDEDEDRMNTTTRCYGFEHRIGHKSMLPRSHFVQVPHVNQLFSWDCGLACVLMALTTIGVNDCSIENLAELCCTTSIWTVDLAYLLQKFSVRFSYYTVTFGANPNYSGETYYKEQLPNDLVRVDTLFKKAVEAGINIGCRSISGEEISCWILSGKYIAIALVDQYKLSSAEILHCSQSWMEDVIIPGFQGNDVGYTGHYVVICGYDSETDEFEIRDPASSREHDRVSSKCLEEARKSFGTDEDLLLISLEESRKPNYSVL
ncbi:hypothetical protein ERO13_A10G226300v2 [Gossypium hirsutum]|nr:hypothetical protein ERO13_A10G226300v2 [Gossypium hirsutum]